MLKHEIHQEIRDTIIYVLPKFSKSANLNVNFQLDALPKQQSTEI